ncbi:MAG: hypothetical protein NTU51_05210 [Bacteroidetes bacterium]|nr:hypothetical protein [Bacteroidota bacterium]
MRYLLPFLLFFFSALVLMGQNAAVEEGTVSYLSSQSIYVKFESTRNIKAGDTLFILKGEKQVPSMVVKDLSSISCVCIPIGTKSLAVGDKVTFRPRSAIVPKPETTAPPSAVVQTEKKPDSVAASPVIAGTPAQENPKPKTTRQSIHGFFGLASYTDFSSNSSTSQRMRYTFSFMGRNLGNTNLSAEVYMSFNHSNTNWSEIQSDVFNGLKVYNLNLNYDFGTKASLLLGRKINPKLSNMGANDGLQFELKFKPITIGLIAGFRPDYTDYSFNASLFQFGAYLYNETRAKTGRTMQTTLAFINQTNNWNTDRRFIYLQHVNALAKNLVFFGSAEMDLYRVVFNQPDSTYTSSNTFNLTNLYVSLNYRVIKQLSLSFSYSARQNVIYYETYKSLLDKLTDPQTLQGFTLQAVVRPVNKLAIGLTGGYRFEKADPKPSKNFYGYVTYSQIPGINVAATATVTILQTSYINGNIYGIGLSKDLVAGKLFAGITYRYTDYSFYSNEMKTLQNVGEIDLSWRIWKKFSMSLYYEGTFEGSSQYNRIYAQLNLGF